MKFLKFDSPIMIFFSKVFEILCLNILFIFCSLPIITIGASYCGLYSGCIALQKGESEVIRKMLLAVRLNFKQATLIWVIQVGIAALLTGGYWFILYGNLHSSIIKILLLFVEYFILIIFLVQAVYIFPLTSRFNNSILEMMKNALLLGIRHFPVTLLLILLNFIPIISLIAPGVFSGILWFLGAGLYAGLVFLEALCLERYVFSEYIDKTNFPEIIDENKYEYVYEKDQDNE